MGQGWIDEIESDPKKGQPMTQTPSEAPTMKIDQNAPAYPFLTYEDGDEDAEVINNPGMTIRTKACIQLRIPKTGEPWLDDLIREARRQDHAAMAIQGMLARNTINMIENGAKAFANDAVVFADALIAELNKDQPDAH